MPSTIVIRKKLDMTPGAVPTVVHRSQYDSDFTIIFELFARTGEFLIESGTTARLRGTKTSGTGYSVPVTLDVSAKTVTVTGDQQMTAAAGSNIFEIVLYQGDLEICSSNFILQVERAAMDADAITDETVVPELEHLEEYTQQAAEQAAQSASVYAESWAVGGTGTREGEDTNNSKYWSEQARCAVAGVTSFNGRSGAVVPATGDYKSEMIRRGNSTTTVEDTLTSLGNTATDLRSRMYTQEGYTSDLRTRMSTAEGTISSQGTRLGTAESDIDDLETRATTAEGNITSQGTRLSTAEGDIDALESRATTAESNITSLQSNKVDKTTPLLNFDDTATDPLTDDGALANALTALGILSDVIPSGGGSLYLKKLFTKLSENFIFPVATRQWNNIATPTAAYYTVATFSPPANSAGIILTLGGNGLAKYMQNKVFFGSNNWKYFSGGGSPNTSGAGNQSIGFAYFETGTSGATINVQQYGYDTSVTNMNGFAVMIRFPHVLRGG